MSRLLAFVFVITVLAVAGAREPLTAGLESSEFRLLRLPDERTGDLVKWEEPELGRPATLTYAIVDRAIDVAVDFGDCRALAPVGDLLARDGLDEVRFLREVEIGLRSWENAARVRFVKAADASSADVLIGAARDPQAITHARVGLKLANRRSSAVVALAKATICLDAGEGWSLAASHVKRGSEIESLSLRLTIAHEAGHVLGLNHPRSKKQLMTPSISSELLGLMDGDRAGIAILYGVP